VTSLYGRLFRYKEGENFRAEENSLSEARADLLNRLALDVQRSFLQLLFKGTRAQAETLDLHACTTLTVAGTLKNPQFRRVN